MFKEIIIITLLYIVMVVKVTKLCTYVNDDLVSDEEENADLSCSKNVGVSLFP